ncbi:MAG: PTS sugar transporter subunit IIA [Dethiobacteria bacterium]
MRSGSNGLTGLYVIRELGRKLLQQGYVKPGFIESVFEREEMGPTCLQGGLAIPHADPQYVNKAGVAVATLVEPVEWWGLQVDLVFLLALRVSDRQLFASLLKVINDPREKSRLSASADSAREIEEEINLAINQPYQSGAVWLK